jgi:hypothetical protein
MLGIGLAFAKTIGLRILLSPKRLHLSVTQPSFKRGLGVEKENAPREPCTQAA